MRSWKEATLDESLPFERLQEVFQEHEIRLAILFGSHASGNVHSRSDVDIAVELEDIQPADAEYNERFFGLSADLCETLETDEVDLVDLQRVSPELAATIFNHGILLAGDSEHVASLRKQLTPTESSAQSPRERFDAALTKIDDHLGGSAVTATDGETQNDE
jgi:uncharacterized protein